jgi:predicted membrane protein
MTEYTAQLAEEEKQHRKPNYLLIFGVLAVITLIEVTVAAHMPVVLVLLSLSKVVLVASYYMHLRFTNAWFTAIFMSPIPFVLLITVALVVALTPGVEGSASASVCSFW